MDGLVNAGGVGAMIVLYAGGQQARAVGRRLVKEAQLPVLYAEVAEI